MTQNKEWHGRAIGLLDLDAFFASVEILDHPEWRGKPLIVGGRAKDRGVVSTASYEARRYGVHSAMPSSYAERLCPQAIWVKPHFDHYRALSHQVMRLILNETPLVEQMSIDEAYFDVTPGRYSNEDPRAICYRLMDEVAALGISCSIGLSTTKTISKIASEKYKPHGFCAVEPGQERVFLAPLPISAMSGIGKATAKKLTTYGMRTIGDIAEADTEELTRLLGVMGPRLKIRAQGKDYSPVRPAAERRQAKSISSERTFPRDLITFPDLRSAVKAVSEHTGRRLRADNLKGTTVTLKLRYSDLSIHTAQMGLTAPTDDSHTIAAAGQKLLEQLWHSPQPVRLVGIGISGFDNPKPRQLQLPLDGKQLDTADSAEQERDNRLLKATDDIQHRFGSQALSYGRDIRLNNLGSQSDTDSPSDHRY